MLPTLYRPISSLSKCHCSTKTCLKISFPISSSCLLAALNVFDTSALGGDNSDCSSSKSQHLSGSSAVLILRTMGAFCRRKYNPRLPFPVKRCTTALFANPPTVPGALRSASSSRFPVTLLMWVCLPATFSVSFVVSEQPTESIQSFTHTVGSV